jgi:hypothetical protein
MKPIALKCKFKFDDSFADFEREFVKDIQEKLKASYVEGFIDGVEFQKKISE